MDRKKTLFAFISVRPFLFLNFFLVIFLVIINLNHTPLLSRGVIDSSTGSNFLASRGKNQNKITIYAIGDIIPHIPIKRAAQAVGNYHFFFQPIASQWGKGDIVFANLETAIVKSSEARLHLMQEAMAWPGFFFAPPDLLEAIKNNGITIVSIANNHILDYGNYGLFSTLQYLNKYQIDLVGVQRKARSKPYLIYNVRGLKISFLAYTMLLNLIHPVYRLYPQVNYLQSNQDIGELLKIIKEMRLNSDMVILSLHWGDEYKGKDYGYTRALAELISKEGVDLILGHHPHVLQPVYWLKNKSTEQKTLVVSSMGNYIANQGVDLTSPEAYRKRLSALFRFTISYSVKKKTQDKQKNSLLINWNYYPLWIKNSWMMANQERISVIQPVFLRCAIQEMKSEIAAARKKMEQKDEVSLHYAYLLIKNYQELMRASELAHQVLGMKYELPIKCYGSLPEDLDG